MQKFCKFFLVAITLCFSFSSIAFATQVLKGERLSVVYSDPALANYAQDVAVLAEEALNVLIELLNFQPRHITLVIDDFTDSYNAVVIPTPHLKTALRPLFPTESQLGFRTEDQIYNLMLHELMHAAQLTYTATEGSDELIVGNERTIFSAGELASVPPAWFLEGIATWIESTYGSGGRLNDAFSNGIIQSMAFEEELPSLEDVSLVTFSQWPYGRARYLFGASFIDYLVSDYGFESIVETLHVYNRGGLIGGFLNDFSTAWFTVTGVSLNDTWIDWQKSQKSKAVIRTFDKATTLTAVMSSMPSATVSPDGKLLAWIDSSQGIMLAEVIRNDVDSSIDASLDLIASEDDSETDVPLVELNNTKVILAGKVPAKLSWYGQNQLIYNRIVRDNITSFEHVFKLDIDTGEESLFSSVKRLKRVTTNPSTNCVFAIRDVRPEPSLLVELCPDNDGLSLGINTIWKAPIGTHFLDISINSSGEVLLSTWTAGKTDLGIFNPLENKLDLLMHDVGQDMDPTWWTKDSGETSILFRSDRHVRGKTADVFEVYELEPKQSTQQKHRLSRLSRTVGGAFQPIILEDEAIIYSSLDSSGFQLASLEVTEAKEVSYFPSPDISYIFDTATSFADSVEPIRQDVVEGFKLESYQPIVSMLPYAVSPIASFSNVDLYNLADAQYFLGGTAFAEDITGKHSFSLTGAVNNILTGHLEGQTLFVNYNYSLTNVLTPLLQAPVNMGLSVGVWPHFPFGEGATETALGARASFNLKLPNDSFVSYANLSAALVNIASRPDDWFLDASARLMISKQRRDTWDYVTDGYRSALFGVIAPTGSTSDEASFEGLSGGAWFTTSYHENVSKLGLSALGISGVAEAYLQAGYNAPLPVSAQLDSDYSLYGHIALRHTIINTGWRYADGLHSIERVSIEPRVSSWYGEDLYLGADVGIYFDTVVNYLAPLSVGAQVGYADGFWYSWGVKLPNF